MKLKIAGQSLEIHKEACILSWLMARWSPNTPLSRMPGHYKKTLDELRREPYIWRLMKAGKLNKYNAQVNDFVLMELVKIFLRKKLIAGWKKTVL